MRSIWKSVMRTAAGVPGVRRVVQLGDQLWGRSPQFRDVYSREIPSPATPFNIFRNAWSSAVPGYETGSASLFDDIRIKWLEAQLGSFSGRRILELGPLEGGHTSMMERAGASVVAIEANQRAFLKCLIVKDTFHLKSEFLYGDFRSYLEVAQPGLFDFVLAIGVLYHMLEPLKLLHDIARVTDAFGLWTHYYDPNIIGKDLHFDPKPFLETVDGKHAEVYRQHYLSSLTSPTFCGGSATTSCWLTKNGLLQYLDTLNYQVRIGDETPHHPNGPSILLFAKRARPIIPTGQ